MHCCQVLPRERSYAPRCTCPGQRGFPERGATKIKTQHAPKLRPSLCFDSLLLCFLGSQSLVSSASPMRSLRWHPQPVRPRPPVLPCSWPPFRPRRGPSKRVAGRHGSFFFACDSGADHDLESQKLKIFQALQQTYKLPSFGWSVDRLVELGPDAVTCTCFELP